MDTASESGPRFRRLFKLAVGSVRVDGHGLVPPYMLECSGGARPHTLLLIHYYSQQYFAAATARFRGLFKLDVGKARVEPVRPHRVPPPTQGTTPYVVPSTCDVRVEPQESTWSHGPPPPPPPPPPPGWRQRARAHGSLHRDEHFQHQV